MKYWQEEVEAIDRMYDEQVPIPVIVETVNADYHEGDPIRSKNSVYYVIRKRYSEDGDAWFETLPLKYPAA